jgi:hypothetical protein
MDAKSLQDDIEPIQVDEEWHILWLDYVEPAWNIVKAHNHQPRSCDPRKSCFSFNNIYIEFNKAEAIIITKLKSITLPYGSNKEETVKEIMHIASTL